MAMKVTKRADLLAKIKREEAEKRAMRSAAEFLTNDTLASVAADLFYSVKILVRASLFYTEPSEDKSVQAYDGLEEMRVRLANQGVEVEWRDILTDEYKDRYGMEEK